jgi:hypothetical protein
MANEEMIKLVVKRIEHEPSTWYQGSWAVVPSESVPSLGEKFYWAPKKGSVASLPESIDCKDLSGEELGVYEYSVTDGFCGTRFCFAGHAVMAAGYVPLLMSGDSAAHDCLDPATGDVMSIPEAARQVLGLDSRQSSQLFSAANNEHLPTFKKLITEVTGVTFED